MSAAALLALVALVGCTGDPAPPESTAPPPIESMPHDHAAHHGGVVGMTRTLHLEVLATTEGRVRVHLSDLARRPLPPGDATGSVTLELPAGDRRLVLTPAGDALEARGPPLARGDVTAHVELRRDAETVEMSFTLPVGAPPELPRLPAACAPPLGPPAPRRRLPRCVLDFGRPVTALGATPDGASVLIAAMGLGVSMWQLPEARPAGALDPPPGGGHHVHPVDALAVRPDGREAAVTVAGRILRHALPGGALVASLPVHRRRLRTVVWSRDGTRLAASALFDGTVLVVDPADGRDIARFTVDGEATALAVGLEGAMALATARGPVALLDARAGAQTLVGGSMPVARALAFVGPRLVAAGDDGRLRIFSLGGTTRERRTARGPAVAQLAAHPGGHLVASAGPNGAVTVREVPSGRRRARLRWHTHPVTALAWAGTTLVSADSAGAVALWDGVGVDGSPGG